MRKQTFVIAVVVASLAIPGGFASAASSYTVRTGDSLWSIAARNDVSISELIDVNGLSLTSTIHPGQTLVLPGGVSGPDAPTRTVTVRRGDSLWSIARGSGTPLAAFLSANGLGLGSTILPGQTLTIPGGGAEPSGSSAPVGSASVPASASTYVVVPGDGLTTIARRVGVTVLALLDANSLSMNTIIHPGQRLSVPAAVVPKEVSGSGHLLPIFESAAREAGVASDFLMAVAYVESRWDPAARSASGAVGVGQLMPRTAAWVERDLIGESGLDITDTTDNIRISAHLLAWLLDEAGGDADRALAMYLQGVYGVRANGVSAAAVRYAERVDTARRRFV